MEIVITSYLLFIFSRRQMIYPIRMSFSRCGPRGEGYMEESICWNDNHENKMGM